MKKFCLAGLGVLLVLALAGVSGCGGSDSSSTSTVSSPAGKAEFTAAAKGKGEPFKLVFLTQPGEARAFEKFGLQPVVGVMDSDGNLVTNTNLPVSIDITRDTASNCTISGYLQVNAVDGKAAFTNLAIDGPGKGFVLVAKSSGLQDGFSQPFDVSE